MCEILKPEARKTLHTAGSHACFAVLRGKARITNAKDLCTYLATHFSKPLQSAFPSRANSVSLKRRVSFYIPTKGADEALQNREGRSFGTVNGIRKLHIITTPQQCKILVRQHSCYCYECLQEFYENCELEQLELTREGSAANTRGQSDDNDPMDDNVHLHVADLVSKDSVVAIAADEDDVYDYYLIQSC